MKLTLPETQDIAGRCCFQCDGCDKTFVDKIDDVDYRTCDGYTYCPECWKLGEFESDEGSQNQIY